MSQNFKAMLVMRCVRILFVWMITLCFVGSAYAQADELTLLDVQNPQIFPVPLIRFHGLEVSSLKLFSGLEDDELSQNFSRDKKKKKTEPQVMAGLEVFYKGIATGYFGFGYSQQESQEVYAEDRDSFHIAAGIDWNMTKKATLNLGLRRAVIGDDTLSRGLVSSQARLELNYKFLHNLFYNAFIDFSISDFDGSARRDNALSAGSGLRYQLNPKLAVSGEYDFTAEDSSALGPDYDSHEFTMHLHKKF